MIVSEAINRPTIGKDTHTMSKDNVIDLKKPEAFVADPITELVRNGAKQILAKALEAEISIFINHYKELTDDLGRQRIVRNGYLPEREIQTGIGTVDNPKAIFGVTNHGEISSYTAAMIKKLGINTFTNSGITTDFRHAGVFH